ncbi:MAG: S8 family serine peptidase [Chloroflexi bacterium]|nr:S8 family serine peptidase [Chloroflexota bacterium]
MALALVLGLLAAGAAPAQVFLRAQPELRVLAARAPAQLVSVIVQKTAAAQPVEEAVTRLGGAITKDLHIINAFAAALPASAAITLARTDGVRWVSLDSAMIEAGGPDGSVVTGRLVNAYIRAIDADETWSDGYQGSSVTVAVVDSGIASVYDLRSSLSNPGDSTNRIKYSIEFNSTVSTTGDENGHGTHVAGIIAGNGSSNSGQYIGIAPKAKLVNVKVANSQGQAATSDVVNGLQWINDNRASTGIRVVNLSMNSNVIESYDVSALDAAVEVLWFNGIVVVVSAGNTGSNGLYPPANDPFVITVGAVDDKGTASTGDDALASFSAYGTTSDGFSKPDLVAPGRNIVSSMLTDSTTLGTGHPANVVSRYYFRMSGTSMAAPMVSAAAALVLQANPNLNPDQVKHRLRSSARPFAQGNGAPYLNVHDAVAGSSSQTANTGMRASKLLWTGSNPVTWGSVNWGSVNWGSVNWGSVNWGSVNWGSVNWGSDYWGN